MSRKHQRPFEAGAFFGDAGLFSKKMDGFEHRPEQERMMQAVAAAIATDDVCLVEAGTGVGKTLAYLVPALLSGRKTVVATGTRALMDQVFDHEIPLLHRLLGEPFSAAILKGRQNYLCHARFLAAVREQALFEGPDSALLSKIGEWSSRTDTGDLAELTDVPENEPVLKRLVSTPESCPGQSCPHFGDCFLFGARRRAAEADLVVTNHHLFFADLVQSEEGGRDILPAKAVLVIDEAHGIEAVATDFFGTTLRSGMVAELHRASKALAAHVNPVRAKHLLRASSKLRGSFERLLKALVPADGRVAVDPGALDDVARKLWYGLDASLDVIAVQAEELAQEQDAATDVGAQANQARLALAAVLGSDDPGMVRVAERHGRAGSLQSLPVEVSGLLQDSLFLSARPVVLVSATLTVAGSTAHVRSRLGIPEGASEVILASPYDFERQVLLYLPRAMPEPNDPAFADAFVEQASAVLEATAGRAFLLFTSYAAMHRAHGRMKDRLRFPVLLQGDAPRDELLRTFKTTRGACLFGTHTFWEGVDVVGEALSCVIIDRLPFDPPDDPVLQARRKAVEDRGENGFYDFQVPRAVIRLRQGFGRLVRRGSDRGVVAIMDGRVLSKAYGRVFLDSLPPAAHCSDMGELEAWCRANIRN